MPGCSHDRPGWSHPSGVAPRPGRLVSWCPTDLGARIRTRSGFALPFPLSTMDASPTRRRSSSQIREQIVAQVLSLLWEHPLRDITVKMIMEGTGLSRPSFYIHFNSIPELIEERLAELEEVMIGTTIQWLSSADDDPGTLRTALDGLIRVVAENGATFRAIAEAATLDAQLATTWGDFMAKWDVGVANRIRAGQELGYVPDIDAERTAFALNRMNATVFIEAFGKRPQQPTEPVIEATFQIWKRTLYGSD